MPAGTDDPEQPQKVIKQDLHQIRNEYVRMQGIGSKVAHCKVGRAFWGANLTRLSVMCVCLPRAYMYVTDYDRAGILATDDMGFYRNHGVASSYPPLPASADKTLPVP